MWNGAAYNAQAIVWRIYKGKNGENAENAEKNINRRKKGQSEADKSDGPANWKDEKAFLLCLKCLGSHQMWMT